MISVWAVCTASDGFVWIAMESWMQATWVSVEVSSEMCWHEASILKTSSTMGGGEGGSALKIKGALSITFSGGASKL